jgi:hypothetical protein
MHRSSIVARAPTSNSGADKVYKELVGGEPYSERARSVLHTQYHARTETLMNPLQIKW